MSEIEAEAVAHEIRRVAERRWKIYHSMLADAGLVEKLDSKTLAFMKSAFTQGVAHAVDEMADRAMEPRP